MLRSPLQRLKNEHVECSLQQLNPILILVFFAHRCRHATPNGGRLSTSFCIVQRAALPHSADKSTSVLRLYGLREPIRQQLCEISRDRKQFVDHNLESEVIEVSVYDKSPMLSSRRGSSGNVVCPVGTIRELPSAPRDSGTACGVTITHPIPPSRRSRTYRLTDSSDLAPEPCVRGIGIYSRMPDHQVLESGYLCRCL
jgi:hypothetical protein